jgi:tRNA(fMet)-specific endonuclease VapC
MYMLDTNICVFLIRRKTRVLLERLKKTPQDGLMLSAITLAELEHGVENSAFPEKNAVALMDFLAIVSILTFDDKAAREYGKVKTDLKKQGTPIGPLDTLIAAHAKAVGATLVTNNTGEFSRVSGLRLEDWTKTLN